MTVPTNFDLVKHFMDTFGQDTHTTPGFPNQDVVDLRVELIDEEFKELKEAIADNDIVEVADALTDLLVVIYGAGHAFGINLDSCFNEVHCSNMSKLDSKGKPIYREDGKILKGEDYFSPDLESVLYS